MAINNSDVVYPSELSVEVAYALPQHQLIIPLTVSAGTVAQQAIIASGMLNQFPEIDLATNQIGVFGKLCQLDTPLRHLDRVEIYRPLMADPKQVRKLRAAEGKVKTGGDNSPAKTK